MRDDRSPMPGGLRKTTRMGRRAIVAALLLGAGGYGVWWTFWRGDPRFVGSWRILDDARNPNQNVIVFQANCTGARWGNVRYEFDWWVDGDCLVIFQESPAFPATTFDLRRKVKDLYELILGYSRRGTERRLRFKQVEAGRMRVWQVDDENDALGRVFEIVRVEE